MNRIVGCMVFMLFAVCDVSAQSEIIIKGKYEGVPIKVVATRYEGRGDRVDILEYEPLNKLQKEVNELNRKIREYENQLKKIQKTDADKSSVETQLKDSNLHLRTENDRLIISNNQLRDTLQQLRQESMSDSKIMQQQMRSLQSKLDSCSLACKRKMLIIDSLSRVEMSMREQGEHERRSAKDSIKRLKKENITLLSDLEHVKTHNRDGVCATVMVGKDQFWNARTRMAPWNLYLDNALQVECAYLHYFSTDIPFAVRTGVGVGMFRGYATISHWHDTVTGLFDEAGDLYEARYQYNGVKENLKSTYVDVPLLLHIGGNDCEKGLQCWVEAGVRMSFLVNAAFSGNGSYSRSVYYPRWNTTLDLPEYGYIKEASLYGNSISNQLRFFTLWGQLAAGVYYPVGQQLGIHVGVCCEHSLLSVSKGKGSEMDVMSAGEVNLTDIGMTRVTSVGVEFGLTYHFN